MCMVQHILSLKMLRFVLQKYNLYAREPKLPNKEQANAITVQIVKILRDTTMIRAAQ